MKSIESIQSTPETHWNIRYIFNDHEERSTYQGRGRACWYHMLDDTEREGIVLMRADASYLIPESGETEPSRSRRQLVTIYFLWERSNLISSSVIVNNRTASGYEVGFRTQMTWASRPVELGMPAVLRQLND